MSSLRPARPVTMSRLVLILAVVLALLTGGGLQPDHVVAEPGSSRAPALTALQPEAGATVLSPEDLQRHQPNELASIPVIEYHVITTDDAQEVDPFVRTAAHMREDLQWLYDHDFYVITTREFLENRISAPAGKRPVLLTFDDAHSSQFRWTEVGENVRMIDPDTAMGVLEGFFQAHPDFGRGGQFAVLPYNCFADGSPLNTVEDCPDKLRWMAANGYEIANHTAGHEDLLDVTDEEFASQVGAPVIWLDGIIQGDANLMDVLVMPYGNYPSRDLHPGQRAMMRDGFTYEGREIRLRGAFMVGANPTESPSSSEYDPLFIARIQAFEESLDEWFGRIENGEILVYVSDGNPDTVVIPDPVPASLADQFDADIIEAAGHQLVRYAPETGEPVSRQPGTGPLATNHAGRERQFTRRPALPATTCRLRTTMAWPRFKPAWPGY